MGAVIPHMLETDAVVGMGAKLPRRSLQGQLVRQRERPQVEQHVVVGAETQHVLHRIGATVRTAQPADVGAFRIGAIGAGQPHAAHLAGEVVARFDPIHDRRAPHDALLTGPPGTGRRRARGRGRSRGAESRRRNGDLLRELAEPKSAHEEARLPLLTKAVLDDI